MMSPLDLTSLVGSRICHDLVSPLGAISNGVELLELSGAVSGPEMALIVESVDNANARIRFFRIAYGAASLDQRIGRNEIVSILADLTKSGRLTYVWGPGEDVLRRDARLVFLLLQCLETSMPYGGTVGVEKMSDGWRIRGEAEKLTFKSELWDRLETTPNEMGLTESATSSQVHFAMAPLLAGEMGVTLAVAHDSQRIEVTF